ncbi:TetR/AcrR family transcriptional regulator [Silvibacterium sp.]|uniref:TetR/AcrR family transcriptional regulator n=1 Tax=Silvibacterium sp. TaxID=1964179 RepID=UPI0039E5ED27
MQDSTDRRTQKRFATRQKISDTATLLFMDRGFDEVTVDQIAEAAGVSRMTVFNHFSRKEDMIFDLDDVGRHDVLAALENRAAGVAPLEALRLFAHRAVEEGRPYVLFCDAGSDRFVKTVQASDVLMARARAIRDELTDLLAGAMAKAVRRPLTDPAARLAASLVVATWTVAFVEAHSIFHQAQEAKKAYKIFLAIIDQGSIGAKAAVQGTRYA